MFFKVLDNWNGNPVSKKVISIVIVRWYRVVVRYAHQSGGFSHGQQTGADTFSLHDQNDLAARTTSRCSQTAGDIIEAHLRSLNPVTIFVSAGPSIHRTYPALSSSLDVSEFASVNIRHERNESISFSFCVPLDGCAIVFD